MNKQGTGSFFQAAQEHTTAAGEKRCLFPLFPFSNLKKAGRPASLLSSDTEAVIIGRHP